MAEPPAVSPGLERLAHLEDRLYRVADLFKALVKENERLRADVSALQTQKEQAREKIEKILDTLAVLERRSQ